MNVRTRVCDRCRRLKRACRGRAEQCTSCEAADLECEYRMPVKRQRRPRRVSVSSDPLESELLQVKQELQRVKQELELRTRAAAQTPASHPSYAFGDNDPGAVIGHMGRLLPNGCGGYVFAGSSTGVHFVNQVEDAVQAQFGESALAGCYTAYRTTTFAKSNQNGQNDVNGNGQSQNQPQNASQIAQNSPSRPRETALTTLLAVPNRDALIDAFFVTWTPMFPLLHYPSFIELARTLSANRPCDLYLVLAVVAIQQFSQGQVDASRKLFAAASPLMALVMAQETLVSVQAFVLTALYHQLQGSHSQCLLFTSLAVRLACLLGLHRHSHRFKFGPLVAETRKRVIWSVYCLDSYVSCHNGMPRLIRDADVDSDLPTDTLDVHIRTHDITLPLPGERGPLSVFLLRLQLTRILGSVQHGLYTTTQRRGGPERISRAMQQLQAWGLALEEQQQQLTVNQASLASLQLLYHAVVLHTNRPALTFDRAHPQFHQSVLECCRSSLNIIELYAKYFRSDLTVQCLYPVGLHLLWHAGLQLLWTKLLLATPAVRTKLSLELVSGNLNSSITQSAEILTSAHRISTEFGSCGRVLYDLLAKTVRSEADASESEIHDPDARELDFFYNTMASLNDLALPLSFLQTD